MNIKFKQKDEKTIFIQDGDKVIGQIFTPSGTSHDTSSAIQVCGFDRAFDLWGCGVYHDGTGKPKQDIQLLFNSNSIGSLAHRRYGNDFECMKCFYGHKDCQCDKLRIFNKKELIVEALEKE